MKVRIQARLIGSGDGGFHNVQIRTIDAETGYQLEPNVTEIHPVAAKERNKRCDEWSSRPDVSEVTAEAMPRLS